VTSPEVDAVDITVPNHLHREVALAAIEAGKPFLVEKPLARTVAEADEVIAAARAAGVVGVYGENMRFSPALEQAKAMIDEGGIGSPILFRATEIHNGPFHADWFWDAEAAGGGAVIDMGIHGLYVAEWLMGARAVRVYAELGTLKWTEHCRNGAEDSAFVTLRFDNGAMAELLNSWAVAGGRDVSAEIYGTAGTIHVDKASGESGLSAYSQEGYGPRRGRGDAAPARLLQPWLALPHRRRLAPARARLRGQALPRRWCGRCRARSARSPRGGGRWSWSRPCTARRGRGGRWHIAPAGKASRHSHTS
jgi:myo-inositol 2-dehydrogenase / D-chiro-inositol 1-dehydrogenase